MRENTSIRPRPINVLTSCFDTRYPLPQERLPNGEVTYLLFVIPTRKVGWGLRVGTSERCERRTDRKKVWGVSECVPLEPNFSVLYPRTDRSVGRATDVHKNLLTDPSKNNVEDKGTKEIRVVLTREVPRLVNVDVVAVLSPPRDAGLRTAPRRALQGHVAALGPHLIATRETVLNFRRNWN